MKPKPIFPPRLEEIRKLLESNLSTEGRTLENQAIEELLAHSDYLMEQLTKERAKRG